MDIERKKRGKKFYYVKKNKIIDNPKILERIKKLVIPPAWINVVISNNPKDKVQCTGYDDNIDDDFNQIPDGCESNSGITEKESIDDRIEIFSPLSFSIIVLILLLLGLLFRRNSSA